MSPVSPTVSALVVAHNEEARLHQCLKQLSFADELVVVLDKCTDNSKTIASEYTHNLIEGSWEREGPRRHAGIDACTSDWIFEVDADETVPPELAEEVRQVVNSSDKGYHLVPIDNYVGGTENGTLVRNGWGASFGTRSDLALFKKGAKTWGPQRVHPAVTLKGEKGHRLKHAILHDVDDNLSDMFARLNRYSDLKALDMVDAGEIGSMANQWRRFISRFWKCYVKRQGYKEGFYGIALSLCGALFPMLSHLKARELVARRNAKH